MPRWWCCRQPCVSLPLFRSVMLCPLIARDRAAGRSGGPLDVEEPDILRVLLDELPPRLHVFAHERREDRVGRGGVVDRDLAERARRGIHRGLPQLLVIHLAETLVALDAVVL